MSLTKCGFSRVKQSSRYICLEQLSKYQVDFVYSPCAVPLCSRAPETDAQNVMEQIHYVLSKTKATRLAVYFV